MKVNINVTKRDIKRGQMRASLSCPIALATNRALGLNGGKRAKKYASIGYRVALIKHANGTLLRAPLPDEARGFIVIFDASGKAEPLKFKLDFKKSRAT